MPLSIPTHRYFKKYIENFNFFKFFIKTPDILLIVWYNIINQRGKEICL